jgi:hypothetical protein
MKDAMEAISQIKLRESKNLDYEMSFTKVEGFLKEFPWVTKYVSRASIKQVYVSRITQEIMDQVLTECGYAGEEVNLLDASGSQVNHVEYEEVITPSHSRRKFFIFGPMIHIPENSILVSHTFEGCSLSTPYDNRIRCIFAGLKEDASKVRFVLSYFELTKAVIVYKCQGTTILDWIKQQIEVERSAIKKECEAIDAEVALK